MGFPEGQEYWDARILGWESARYSPWAALNPFAWTVRNRARAAEEILRQEVQPASKVIELGCGTGIFAEKLRSSRLSDYLGFDVSPVAIERARRRFNAKPDPRFSFDVTDATQRIPLEADLVFFLGLTDWLPPGALEPLLATIRARTIVFSFTSSRSSWSLPFYHAYHRWLRGNRPREFPRSFSEDHIAGVCSSASWNLVRVVGCGKIDPGRLVVLRRTTESVQ